MNRIFRFLCGGIRVCRRLVDN